MRNKRHLRTLLLLWIKNVCAAYGWKQRIPPPKWIALTETDFPWLVQEIPKNMFENIEKVYQLYFFVV